MTDQLEMMPDEGKQDSPRLAWMKRHGVHTYQCDRGFYVSVFNGLPSSRTHFEPTEDEALGHWAKRNGIPLWNEDEYINGKEAE